MTEISANVVLRSISNIDGSEITTVRAKFPRWILPQVLTHRQFSRNTSSSRAIPVKTLIKSVEEDPVFPVYFGKAQRGMKAHQEVDEATKETAQGIWSEALSSAVYFAEQLSDLGIAKEVTNRLLEPFSHTEMLITTTSWENYFNLRLDKETQEEHRLLAQAIKDAIKDSDAQFLGEGQWHLPYVTDEDKELLPLADQLKVSAARCARISYLNREGKVPSLSEDLGLYERLAGSNPKHLSPLEHQATPMPGFHANFHGWISFRTCQEGEYLSAARTVAYMAAVNKKLDLTDYSTVIRLAVHADTIYSHIPDGVDPLVDSVRRLAKVGRIRLEEEIMKECDILVGLIEKQMEEQDVDL